LGFRKGQVRHPLPLSLRHRCSCAASNGSTRMTMVSRRSSEGFHFWNTGQDALIWPSFYSPKVMRFMHHPPDIHFQHRPSRSHLLGSSRPRPFSASHYGDLANAAHLNRLINEIQLTRYTISCAISRTRELRQLSIPLTSCVRHITPCWSVSRLCAGSGRETSLLPSWIIRMFGASPPAQNEKTPFYPRSPLWREQSGSSLYSINNGRLTISSSVMEFFLITSLPAGAKRLLRAKSRALWAELS